MPEPGKLFVVATPIGDYRDITLRALEVLQAVDAVICEEYRLGSTLLKKLNLPAKELIALNEHNEVEQVPELALRMVNGASFALVSDCGTPVFADPGYDLIRQAAEYGLTVVPVPGVSSLMAALSVLDFHLEKFVFGGFLPREAAARRAELMRLKALRMPLVLMDTPYRLKALLEETARVFGKDHAATLAYNLTLPDEKIYRGTLNDIAREVGPRKGEFVLIVH